MNVLAAAASAARTSTARRSRRSSRCSGGAAWCCWRPAALALRARARSCRCSPGRARAPRSPCRLAVGRQLSVIAGALRDRRPDAGPDGPVLRGGRGAAACSRGAVAPREAGARRVPRAAARLDRGHGRARRGARTSSPCSSAIELLSIPLYVLCATELRRATLARVRPEVPDHRLGRVGHAALRAGAALRRDRRDRLRAIAAAIGAAPAHDVSADRHRAVSSASPSRPRWRRSTSGRPTSTRAPRRRSPRSWRSRPRPPRSACCSGSSTSP